VHQLCLEEIERIRVPQQAEEVVL
jgi:transcription-repair coupling factor (superfamily II helicase)